MFAGHSRHMNAAPPRPFRQLSRLVLVDELICDQMHVKAMSFVQPENTQSLQIRPRTKQDRQQMIPPLPRFLDRQKLFEGERLPYQGVGVGVGVGLGVAVGTSVGAGVGLPGWSPLL